MGNLPDTEYAFSASFICNLQCRFVRFHHYKSCPRSYSCHESDVSYRSSFLSLFPYPSLSLYIYIYAYSYSRTTQKISSCKEGAHGFAESEASFACSDGRTVQNHVHLQAK